MAQFNQPSDIARETLRLAMRRIHQRLLLTLYHEIAETPVKENFPEKALKQLVTGTCRCHRSNNVSHAPWKAW